MKKVMKQFALTGGFGTGKSTVGRMFEDLGIPRIDADALTHELIAPDRVAWQQILSDFGEEILLSDRNIDRRKLADIIFKNPAQRKRLEAIIHPKVRDLMHERVEELRRQGQTRVILEIPLLFEAGWERDEPLEAVLVVTADEKTQIERSKRKFGLDEAAIRARIQAQMPLAEKTKKATFVIDNNGDLAKTKSQVETIFKKLV